MCITHRGKSLRLVLQKMCQEHEHLFSPDDIAAMCGSHVLQRPTLCYAVIHNMMNVNVACVLYGDGCGCCQDVGGCWCMLMYAEVDVVCVGGCGCWLIRMLMLCGLCVGGCVC